MDIGKYVSSLLPSFEKSQIEEDIRIQRDELSNNTIPPFETASEWFKSEGFKSRDNKDYDKLFQRQVDFKRDAGDDYITIVLTGLKNSLDTIHEIEERLDKHFGRDVTSGGMTYTRANILRYIEITSFANRYARKLLLWTLANEKTAAGRTIGDPLSKAETAWLHDNRQAFLRSMSILTKKPKDIMHSLTNIPDMIVVPAETDIAKETVGAAKLDPLKMNLIPAKLNPIYHVRMAITEWQVSRYKAAKEEKRALEYRMLALKEISEGREDAKLEQQIEYTENRIRKLNHKMAKIEED